MTGYRPFGARLRLDRLSDRGDDHFMIVPLDHSVADGPIDVDSSLDVLVEDLADNGVDAVVLHRGTLRQVRPDRFRRLSLVVHLSASTSHAPDPDAKYLVANVETALRLGADAVSVHVNMGSRAESTQIADLARTAESCDRWNLPLLAMIYARGPQIADARKPELLAHAAGIAADLGADLVKIAHPGSADALATIVRTCPIPIVMAGGAPVDDVDELLATTAATIRAGAAGVAMGRNIFGADDPGAMARRVSDIVHDPRLHARNPVLRTAPEMSRAG